MDNLNIRIYSLVVLGDFFRNYKSDTKEYQYLDKAILNSIDHNGWFTKESIAFALKSWGNILNHNSIKEWITKYDLSTIKTNKTIALILAGNIPMVGLHDVLSVWILGYTGIVKCSSKDKFLIPFIINFLESQINLKTFYFTQGKLKNYNAVIATGSDNTSRYFDYYFSNVPNVIRKNRNSIAVLDGNETDKQMESLAKDILTYYGLGCRNVSKIFLPEGFNLNKIFKGLFHLSSVVENNKYANNYDYNKAVFLMSEYDFLDNGFFLLRKSNDLSSPLSTANYEFYSNEQNLNILINNYKESIQCIIGNKNLLNSINFGISQEPRLSDYADNIDTIDFLSKI